MEIESRQKGTRLSISPNFLAGYIAGTLSVLICAPLDTIKNRLQVQTFCKARVKGKSLMAIIQSTLREEGLSGLYRGMSVTLVTLPISLSVFFATYSQGKWYWKSLGLQDFWANLISAGVAGCVSNLVTNPLWLARTRMMSQQLHQSNKYKSLIQTLETVLREEGVRALYQGMSASMLGISHVMVQFPIFEYLRKMTVTEDRAPSNIEMLYLSLVPKMLACMVSYPHEVLRSRLQDLNKSKPKAFTGIVDLVQVTWRREGIKGFYAGFKVNFIRMIPATYIMLTGYERALHWLHHT